ncbi:hypothetical protein [Bradyrhizobium sp.]|uniref:hypothetical protein n=1 Tax=Bradyrhizobium sp. TaxID=376 RepID=UPI0025BEAC4C|nr:hypothetical protein [Bradyrhizobium sp.]
MDVKKQREIIRLWNRMRRVEGPIAEEIRIQILERFADAPNAQMSDHRAGAWPHPVRARASVALDAAATTSR